MRRAGFWFRGLAVSACLGVACGASAAGAPGSCESEASGARAATTARYFVALAASRGVFYDRSGPSFIMLMKTDAAQDKAEMGAVGIYANGKGQPVFGAIPWQTYDAFLSEPGKKSQDVMLRLEINEAQYQRVLGVLRSWERRARQDELLYPDELPMNNILLVKQATEELNRCRQFINLYQLDWGINDRISDNNPPASVPYLVFAELRRLNAARHVSDAQMPDALALLAGAKPLPARRLAVDEKVFVPLPASASGHDHHMHHMHGASTMDQVKE